eukprot:193492-Chlamydomonas_euryale.AAC.2
MNQGRTYKSQHDASVAPWAAFRPRSRFLDPRNHSMIIDVIYLCASLLGVRPGAGTRRAAPPTCMRPAWPLRGRVGVRPAFLVNLAWRSQHATPAGAGTDSYSAALHATLPRCEPRGALLHRHGRTASAPHFIAAAEGSTTGVPWRW